MQGTVSLAPDKNMNADKLNAFVVRAKAATYVGNGEHISSCRPGSHDLRFEEDQWAYHDSYFGGSDFIGEEVVYFEGKPVWAMNYYGRILRADLISASQAGQMIKASLSRMYQEGRFLGNFEHTEQDLTYIDANHGTVDCFHGHEVIRRGQVTTYELDYHGGLIKD
jgi:hypothetical protein